MVPGVHSTGVADPYRQRPWISAPVAASSSRFDRREGATACDSSPKLANQARSVRLTGALDHASIGDPERRTRGMNCSMSVELDLCDVHALEADRSALLAWAQVRARERDVKLVIRSARPSTRPDGRCRAREPRTPSQRAAGCRDERT